MKCPQCGKELLKKSFNIMVPNVCEACPGIWFTAGDIEEILDHKLHLDQLVDLPDEHTEQEQSDRKLICPVCLGDGRLIRMKTHATSKVEVDTCMVCYGKWVSGKGLRNLIEYCTPKGLKAFFLKLFPSKSKKC